MRLRWFLVFLTVLLALPPRASAHPMQVEAVVANLRPQAKFFFVEFVGNVQDITQIPDVTLGDERRNPDGTFPRDFVARLEKYLNENFRVTQGEKPLAGELTHVRYDTSLDVTRSRFTMAVRYPRPPGEQASLTIANTLFDYLPNAETLVIVGGTTRRLKTGESGTIDPGALVTNVLRNIAQFLTSGIEHIFTGPDHILFILGLLLVSANFSSLVKTLTGFTIAHSLTLVLTTLGIVSFPARWVDVVVALSIAFVGLENIALLRKGRPDAFRHRFWVASAFGLIHGFAFAGNLRDMGLPEGSALIWSLLAFNLGVEVAQVLICAAAYPLFQRWKKDVEKRRGVGMNWQSLQTVLSGLIAGAGLVWMFQRLVGG